MKTVFLALALTSVTACGTANNKNGAASFTKDAPASVQPAGPASADAASVAELQKKIVSILSNEKKMRKLLNLNLAPAYARFMYETPKREGSSFNGFLQDVVGRVGLGLDFDSPSKFDVSKLDANPSDPRVAVASLRSVFVALRDFNSVYASDAIVVFDQFLQHAPATTSSSITP